MTTLYGIKNCDTVKKTRQWLDANHIVYTYHDFRTDGINENMVKSFLEKSSLDALINKRSTTWKSLSDELKESLSNSNVASFCTTHETLIKRPVLEHNGKIYFGFDLKIYSQLFNG